MKTNCCTSVEAFATMLQMITLLVIRAGLKVATIGSNYLVLDNTHPTSSQARRENTLDGML